MGCLINVVVTKVVRGKRRAGAFCFAWDRGNSGKFVDNTAQGKQSYELVREAELRSAIERGRLNLYGPFVFIKYDKTFVVTTELCRHIFYPK